MHSDHPPPFHRAASELQLPPPPILRFLRSRPTERKRTLVFSRSAPSSAPVRNAVDADDDAGGGGEIAFTVTAKGKGAAELRERERRERAERYSPPFPELTLKTSPQPRTDWRRRREGGGREKREPLLLRAIKEGGRMSM